MSADLAARLAAVLDAARADVTERRRLAEAATASDEFWFTVDVSQFHRGAPAETVWAIDSNPRIIGSAHREADADHIVANDPQTVLAQCDRDDRLIAATEAAIAGHVANSTDLRAWAGVWGVTP